MVDKNKTYIGIVEENNDPNKLGRVRIRVVNVFDELEVEDIPWASPWKDLNGNSINIPEIGKVLLVVFDQGDSNKPEYIYANHYNVNLENKLKSLSDEDYKSMKSILFDHKTQIYVNDSEGLKIDHKYNNINITEDSINFNLKDNNRNVNIGDETAGQQAILGNHWMDWFDEFVDNLLGLNGGPFLGNLTAPVIANPAFIAVLTKYKALRDPVFLSHHVNIVDNNKATTVRGEDRENEPQYGDTWNASKRKNDKATKANENFSPVDGAKQEFDPNYVPPETDGTPDDVLSETPYEELDLSKTESNERIDKLVRFMESKNYKVYDTPGVLNIVSMRKKDNGDVTNVFDDVMYVFFKTKQNKWQLVEYQITTTPGYKPRTTELPDNVAVLALGQYVDQYKLGFHQGRKDHKCLKFARSVVHRNDRSDEYNYTASTEEGYFGINIHRSNPRSSSTYVFNWSHGCQVFKNVNQFKQFIKLCENQVSISNKDTFTYTLCRKSEFDSFS
jgi:hypothetical protein